MNKTITLNHITLAGCCLLFASAQALAEPLVTDDQLEMIEPEEIIEPEIEEISASDDALPLVESLPATETEPSLDLEEVSVETNETPDELEAADEVEIVDPTPIDTDTSTEVTEQRTETESTGDIMEMRADETLPVRVLNFPRRGMSMEKVKNELGDPVEISETIGKPPITSWSYNDRIVYFEYSRVVHVVDTH